VRKKVRAPGRQIEIPEADRGAWFPNYPSFHERIVEYYHLPGGAAAREEIGIPHLSRQFWNLPGRLTGNTDVSGHSFCEYDASPYPNRELLLHSFIQRLSLGGEEPLLPGFFVARV
jgi:hypothetical protein